LRCGVFSHGFVRSRCDASLAAFKPDVLRAFVRIFVGTVFASYRARAKREGIEGGEGGAVTMLQRFGGSLNLNLHMHVAVLDGVFTRDDQGRVHFHPAPPPDSTDLQAIPNIQGEYSLSKWADLLRTDLAVAKLPTLFDGKHPITFHALRRTFMSLLEGEGVSRDLISALAGHSGKTVADRHYIAKNIERFYEVVKKLPVPERLPWISEDESGREGSHDHSDGVGIHK
jgi:hypothetical protein